MKKLFAAFTGRRATSPVRRSLSAVVRALIATVFLLGLHAGQASTLLTCPSTGGGDWSYCGFYVPSYPGATLDSVTLQLFASSPGTYQLSLVVRSATYDGSILGTSSATVALSSSPAGAAFLFPSVPIMPGSLVCFVLSVTSGPNSFVYLVDGDCTTVVLTDDTTPPLSTFRRYGVSLTLTGSQNGTSCPETNGVKCVQWPNLYGGLDIWDSSSRPNQVTDGPWVLADDFVCTNTGPITDIHLWGSWQNDQPATGAISFWLGMYDDVPKIGTNFSHPGKLLWQQWFAPEQYSETVWPYTANESFLDPGLPQNLGPENIVWYYCFYPTNLFQTNGNTYWLSAFAQLPAGMTNVFGWKTATNLLNDVSVHAFWSGSPLTNNAGWTRTMQFPTNGPLDLAFKLTTAASQTNPPSCCPDSGGVKWQQSPNIFSGIDVDATYSPPDPVAGLPWVLADDFPCTNTGPITDIHLWGSWLNSHPDPSAVFTLGLWNDAPTNAATAFSHPNLLLWTQTYSNNQYVVCPYTNRTEGFYDGFLDSLGTSSNLFYLCFNVDPGTPFTQHGTQTAKTNYWLSVTVWSPSTSSYFGWKSSSEAYNDAAVCCYNGFFFPPPTEWNPMTDLGGARLNLAFKITTSNCPPPILTCTDKTVQCNSGWSPDQPTVTDPCCGPNQIPTIVGVTNYGICPQYYLVTWALTNCLGMAGTCVETITVTDTNPPTVIVPAGGELGCNPFPLPDDAMVLAQVLVTDDCGVRSTNVTHLDGGFGCRSNRVFTVTATDICTNATTKIVLYSWTTDTIPPIITAVPPGGFLGCNPASIPDDLSARLLVQASDNCGVLLTNVTHVDGGTACLSNRTFTIVVKDNCFNATITNAVYTWTTDLQPPTITAAPVGADLGCNPTNLPTDASLLSGVMATDNCGLLSTNVTHVDGSSGCHSNRTFTITVKDKCLNLAATNVIYTWTADTTPPSLTCATNKTVNCACLLGTGLPSEWVLTNFTGTGGSAPGATPEAALMVASDGMLYGSTWDGGTYGLGTVFRVKPDGSGYQVMHHFSNINEGKNPHSRLVEGSGGWLYGTTALGGSGTYGTVYALNPRLPSPYGFVVLHNFAFNGSDGFYAYGGLMVGTDGCLYGTTYRGGTGVEGTVYRLSQVTQSTCPYQVIHNFSPSDNQGYGPYDEPGLVQGNDGWIYGTTFNGGTNGAGTVFKLNPTTLAYSVLHHFPNNSSDGDAPIAGLLVGSDGKLYGGTYYGGVNGYGVVFRLDPTNPYGPGGYTIVHPFPIYAGDGQTLVSSLSEGCDGALYGTSYGGGTFGNGTAYKLNKDGSGYTVMYSFAGAPDGKTPYADLLITGGGAMYGTTTAGGGANAGTVFKLAWAWPFDQPGVQDNCCTNVNLTWLDTTNGTCPKYITRSWTATDCCSNSMVCTQTLTVVDSSPLILTCAGGFTTNCDSAWSFTGPTLLTNGCCCTNLNLSWVDLTNSGCPKVVTRTWLASDCRGSNVTCSQTVTLVDTTPPVLYCTNRTVQCGSAWWPPQPPYASDFCCGTNVSVSLVDVTTNGSPCKQVLLHWTAADCCNNSTSCTQTVALVNMIPPVFTLCPPDRTVVCGSAWDFGTPAAAGACCGTNINIVVVNTVTNSACPAVMTRTWQALDCCGTNTAICVQNVTVTGETTPPTLHCPADIIQLSCNLLNYTTWAATVSDPCSASGVTYSHSMDSPFLLGTTNIVHCVATNACHLSTSCDFRVIFYRPPLGEPTIRYSHSTGMITITWTGGGMLQYKDDLSTDVPPWANLTSTSPYSVLASEAHQFYRLHCILP